MGLLGKEETLQIPKSNRLTSVIISSAILFSYSLSVTFFPSSIRSGMIFALIYERSQRLALAIWAHVGFNATTMFSLLVLD